MSRIAPILRVGHRFALEGVRHWGGRHTPPWTRAWGSKGPECRSSGWPGGTAPKEREGFGILAIGIGRSPRKPTCRERRVRSPSTNHVLDTSTAPWTRFDAAGIDPASRPVMPLPGSEDLWLVPTATAAKERGPLPRACGKRIRAWAQRICRHPRVPKTFAHRPLPPGDAQPPPSPVTAVTELIHHPLRKGLMYCRYRVTNSASKTPAL